MANKKVSFGTKPQSSPIDLDQWVQAREGASEQSISEDLLDQQVEKMKRLTLDIPESLHKIIKGKAVAEGRTMVDMLRELLENTYG